MNEETWILAQYNPPCLVYQYRCNLCPFFKGKENRCLLNTDWNDLTKDDLK